MIIYPAIDIMGGRCVRLARGKFEDATRYSSHPSEAVALFADAGAEWVHVVDLDGARAGSPVQHELLAALSTNDRIKLQVAGGFRSRDQVARLLECGASRIVIGSLAVEQPEVVEALLEEFGAEAIALALDVELVGGRPMVAHRGWTKISDRSLSEVAESFVAARHILVTDISRDGMQRGANLELIQSLCRVFPNLQVQASGGVARVEELAPLRVAGAAGVIIGKAIWEGSFTLSEALAHARV